MMRRALGSLGLWTMLGVVALCGLGACSDGAAGAAGDGAEVQAEHDATATDAAKGDGEEGDGDPWAPDVADVPDAIWAPDDAVEPLPDAGDDADDVSGDAADDVALEVTVPDAAADDAPETDDVADDASGDVPDDVPAPPTGIGPTCFAEIWDPATGAVGPDYDQFPVTAAEHCWGTNHQDIQSVDHVVFLGDSVTVGTPNLQHVLPTDNNHFWRNELATFLRDHFGLEDGGFIDFGLWKTWDALSNKAGKLEAGDFKSCAKWGARTDDLLAGGGQIHECFPTGGSPQRTLVVFTMGGNDISKITQIGGEASPEEVAAGYPAAWALADSTVAYLREALFWLKDPARFPKGSFVIFANPFEFTDGTGDVDACPAAGLAGYKDWAQPEVLEAIVVHVLEGFMQAAVDTGTDMVWMLEHFCGHGFVATGPDADPNNRCYRGPDAALYFDDTCIHPSDAGHHAIFEMFRDTVLE